VPSHFILYVADQKAACTFYQQALALEPRLDVPGMTEFDLPGGGVLGLMPESGIRNLLGDVIPESADGTPAPRAELYLVVAEPEQALDRAVAAGAELLQPVQPRDWGHEAGYCRDLDGHILAFAYDPGGSEANDDNDPNDEVASAPIGMFRRLHNAIGPVAAGLVLDFWDLVTFGPLGWTVGPVIGLIVGWYLGSFYQLRIWSRLGLALLSAGYLAVPMTAFIPLGTLVSALARMLSKPSR
jgi:uncharacterized protein